MAYFANGTEGAVLDNQCEKCLYGMNEEVLCPVSAVQTLFNYDQIGNEQLKEAMEVLVDNNGLCKMREAMKQAGMSFDTSHLNQMGLGF